ncbi:hypothetical protein [Paenibacillus wynnii]|uniref:Lipoprotein n=1 Tax=Paenibacillus wynnii TaxID=268407 RepID=A0A098M3H3_9BACL|nr:hypothetical protein [Paenibacillus wynnii]KGE16556.1 hypothetical protein PWYN_17720 [Paenibacillus wynnii]
MLKIWRTTMMFVAMIFLLTACNTETIKHHYTFEGEASQWSASYVQDVTEKYISKKGKPTKHETRESSVFQLIYKGEQSDLGNIKLLKYSYKGTAGGASRSQEGPVYLKDLKFVNAGSEGSFEREDSVIRVEVEWDGQKEQFDLRVHK